MRILLFLALCSLITISCKQGNDVPQNSVAHKIYLEKDNGLVYCYADSQRVVFNNDYMDGGAMAMMLYHIDSCVYVIGDFAAIHFEDDGFMAATTRLTNPDAKCTADEVFAIRDNFYSHDGTLIRKGEDEYSYDDMIAQYSDSLVNADGIRLGNNVIQ